MSKGIFVVMEQRYGKVQNVGLELVGEATRLKEDLKDDVVAVLLGHDIKGEVDKIFHYGADKVVLVDDPMLKDYVTEPYTKAVCEVIKAFDPEIMLFGASSIGRDVAPRVASRVKTGLVADTTGLRMAKTQEELDKEAAMGNATPERALLMTRPAFGGNIMATLMVSGGRGVGSAEGFDVIRDMADALGAEVGSSRACVDAGWIEKDRQVGQTGKTVRPDLYMACGISGAIQHVAGMENSELIIAINKNESAPIFEVADLGIVGDLKQILPKLADAVRKYKAAKANRKTDRYLEADLFCRRIGLLIFEKKALCNLFKK